MSSYYSLIDDLKVIDWPLNGTNSLFSFFDLKLKLDIKSFEFIIYQLIPRGIVLHIYIQGRQL